MAVQEEAVLVAVDWEGKHLYAYHLHTVKVEIVVKQETMEEVQAKVGSYVIRKC